MEGVGGASDLDGSEVCVCVGGSFRLGYKHAGEASGLARSGICMCVSVGASI